MVLVVVIVIFFSMVNCLSTRSKVKNPGYCRDLEPTHDFDEDGLLGMWYIHEYIFHKEKNVETKANPYCPIIQIRTLDDYTNGALINRIPPTYQTPYAPPLNTPYLNRNYGQQTYPEPHRIRNFVLEWHEGLWKDEYHIKVNTSHKGFWPTDLPNTSVDNMYRYFGGVIQVLKMANNYLVLNFCMRLPHSQLYSVVLSRSENQLTPEDLASIHNIFTMKHLSTSSLKRVCDSGAGNLTISGILLAVMAVFKWVA